MSCVHLAEGVLVITRFQPAYIPVGVQTQLTIYGSDLTVIPGNMDDRYNLLDCRDNTPLADEGVFLVQVQSLTDTEAILVMLGTVQIRLNICLNVCLGNSPPRLALSLLS